MEKGKSTIAPKSGKMAAAQRPGSTQSISSSIPPDQRQHMIEEAAYYRAERRGFYGGDPLQDWLEAEAEIDGMLSGKRH